jgi:hypothetical protein
MPGVQARDLNTPDETRTPPKTKIDIVNMGDTTAARFTFEPGWRWSECIKPVVGTDSCQVRHDAWVVGEETFVAYEFESKSAEVYAKGS